MSYILPLEINTRMLGCGKIRLNIIVFISYVIQCRDPGCGYKHHSSPCLHHLDVAPHSSAHFPLAEAPGGDPDDIQLYSCMHSSIHSNSLLYHPHQNQQKGDEC